jgi:hypothetical protein
MQIIQMPGIYESNTKITLPIPNELRSAYLDGEEAGAKPSIESVACLQEFMEAMQKNQTRHKPFAICGTIPTLIIFPTCIKLIISQYLFFLNKNSQGLWELPGGWEKKGVQAHPYLPCYPGDSQ